jgi:ribosomal protein S8E
MKGANKRTQRKHKKRTLNQQFSQCAINNTLNAIYGVGGELTFKILRKSKKKVHPRKIMILLSIPIAGKYEQLKSLQLIQELKQRSIYKGCITEIRQTSPLFCLVTFGFIVKSTKYLDDFIRLLTKLAFDTKYEVEKVTGM